MTDNVDAFRPDIDKFLDQVPHVQGDQKIWILVGEHFCFITSFRKLFIGLLDFFKI